RRQGEGDGHHRRTGRRSGCRQGGGSRGGPDTGGALQAPPGDPHVHTRSHTFTTFTASLEALAEGLGPEGGDQGVQAAAGPYWKPVWYVLEGRGAFELLLVNARHVKILPGRKTDVADAAWLAELLEHGLLRSSFVPPPDIRRLRDLTRYRKRLIQTHTAECQP